MNERKSRNQLIGFVRFEPEKNNKCVRRRVPLYSRSFLWHVCVFFSCSSAATFTKSKPFCSIKPIGKHKSPTKKKQAALHSYQIGCGTPLLNMRAESWLKWQDDQFWYIELKDNVMQLHLFKLNINRWVNPFTVALRIDFGFVLLFWKNCFIRFVNERSRLQRLFVTYINIVVLSTHRLLVVYQWQDWIASTIVVSSHWNCVKPIFIHVECLIDDCSQATA